MASDVVIRAEGLGKRYIIGHQAENERYTTFRDSLSRSLRGWGRSARDMLAGRALVAGDETEEFWALRNIDFEIRRGEVVGIIGRNGAGKSTLLKVLSRITEPTEGRVTIDGRAASLLEVGTGFHPELSGRENIYLNGAILGMSREEIRRKFDEIVAFAGVERFLDTPVKRYSSGMYVRLAFAVAAHLEPEILIVDEVLAVGDAEFQKKCLGKMQDVAGHGRTVLFVSHNMAAVRSLCSKGILLSAGSVSGSGEIDLILSRYRESIDLSFQNKNNTPIESNGIAISNIQISPILIEDQTKINFTCNITVNYTQRSILNIFIFNAIRQPIGAVCAGGLGGSGLVLPRGHSRFECSIDIPRLAQGNYYIDLNISTIDKITQLLVNEAATIICEPRQQSGEAEVLQQEWGHGCVWFPCQYQILS